MYIYICIGDDSEEDVMIEGIIKEKDRYICIYDTFVYVYMFTYMCINMNNHVYLSTYLHVYILIYL
jgi:hypothetical protein